MQHDALQLMLNVNIDLLYKLLNSLSQIETSQFSLPEGLIAQLPQLGRAEFWNREKVKKAVLLLDDQPNIKSVMSVALKSAGFAVDAFNEPLKALSELKDSVRRTGEDEKYRLVISDTRMLAMSGFEFARLVNDLDAKVKIVLITAFEVKKRGA